MLTLFAMVPFWVKPHSGGTSDFHADFCSATLAGDAAVQGNDDPENLPNKAEWRCDHCTGCAGISVTQAGSVVSLAVAVPADVVSVTAPPRPQRTDDVVSGPRGPPLAA